MSWRPHGHARVSARAPRAAAICDRCGALYNHNALRWQYEFQGVLLQNLKILVCSKCLDRPNPQLKAKILSPDPVPIYNARPEPFTTTGYSYQESNIMCQPSNTTVGTDEFSPDFSGDFDVQATTHLGGLDGDGPELTMPDGSVTMLMPDGLNRHIPPTPFHPPPGSDFSDDFSNDFGP